MPSLHQPLLLVEDSPEDRTATLRAFKKAGLGNPVFTCENGDDALDYLYQRGSYSDPLSAPRPGVILLDLNMPGTDGRDVLADIKSNDELKTIPVVVLTTSNDATSISATKPAQIVTSRSLSIFPVFCMRSSDSKIGGLK